MKYVEKAITFACAGQTLVGILAAPLSAGDIGRAHVLGVVLIVGGPQYRAGSHRQFVLLSRALAAAGYPVLRFDYRGMGDSTGEQRDFLQVTPDIASAIDALQQQVPSVTQVALWGLCDAASAALLYCHDINDARVRGLCLLNPWVRSAASLAKTQVKHYYIHRLRQKDFWIKLFRGRVAFESLPAMMRNIGLVVKQSIRKIRTRATDSTLTGAKSFQQRMAIAWRNFSGHVFLGLSSEDYTAKEFTEHTGADTAWIEIRQTIRLQQCKILGADHTFSGQSSRLAVEALTLEWLTKIRFCTSDGH